MNALLPGWELPPEKPTLTNQSLHLWFVRLDIAKDQLSYLETLLSPDERLRAEKYKFDHLRAHFMVFRGLLRSFLGNYLNLKPEDVRFLYNPWGKPTLAPPLDTMLHFNVSHTNNLALFAFTKSGPVGVDLEFINPQTDVEQTGAMVFTPSEMATLRALSPESKHHTFFQFWARKEAFIKAVGGGFSIPPKQYDVCQTPEKPVLYPTDVPNPTSWFIRDISIFPGYTAAVARELNEWPVTFYTLPGQTFP